MYTVSSLKTILTSFQLWYVLCRVVDMHAKALTDRMCSFQVQATTSTAHLYTMINGIGSCNRRIGHCDKSQPLFRLSAMRLTVAPMVQSAASTLQNAVKLLSASFCCQILAWSSTQYDQHLRMSCLLGLLPSVPYVLCFALRA